MNGSSSNERLEHELMLTVFSTKKARWRRNAARIKRVMSKFQHKQLQTVIKLLLKNQGGVERVWSEEKTERHEIESDIQTEDDQIRYVEQEGFEHIPPVELPDKRHIPLVGQEGNDRTPPHQMPNENETSSTI